MKIGWAVGAAGDAADAGRWAGGGRRGGACRVRHPHMPNPIAIAAQRSAAPQCSASMEGGLYSGGGGL